MATKTNKIKHLETIRNETTKQFNLVHQLVDKIIHLKEDQKKRNDTKELDDICNPFYNIENNNSKIPDFDPSETLNPVLKAKRNFERKTVNETRSFDLWESDDDYGRLQGPRNSELENSSILTPSNKMKRTFIIPKFNNNNIDMDNNEKNENSFNTKEYYEGEDLNNCLFDKKINLNYGNIHFNRYLNNHLPKGKIYRKKKQFCTLDTNANVNPNFNLNKMEYLANEESEKIFSNIDNINQKFQKNLKRISMKDPKPQNYIIKEINNNAVKQDHQEENLEIPRPFNLTNLKFCLKKPIVLKKGINNTNHFQKAIYMDNSNTLNNEKKILRIPKVFQKLDENKSNNNFSFTSQISKIFEANIQKANRKKDEEIINIANELSTMQKYQLERKPQKNNMFNNIINDNMNAYNFLDNNNQSFGKQGKVI